MIEGFKIFRYFGSTLIVLIGTIVVVTPLSICTAFTFAKYRFRGSNFWYLMMVAAMTVPAQITIIPVFIAFGKLGLVNNYAGMIILNMGMICSTVVMMTSYFRGIPNELLDSAKLDGCGVLRVMTKVVIPNCSGAISTAGMFSFLGNWKSYTWPLIATTKTELRTLPIGMKYLMQESSSEYQVMMALRGESTERVVCDYIAGMTDIYAIGLFEELFVPQAWK